MEENNCNMEEFTTIPPTNDELVAEGDVSTPLEVINQKIPSNKIIFEEALLDNNIPLFEEEEEDPSEVEEDDPEEQAFGNNLMNYEDPAFIASIINTEVVFTADDLEDFLNDPEEENMDTNVSGNSFHSTHQSMLSSSSMVNQMDGLNMNINQYSKSSSDKRRTNDGGQETKTLKLSKWVK